MFLLLRDFSFILSLCCLEISLFHLPLRWSSPLLCHGAVGRIEDVQSMVGCWPDPLQLLSWDTAGVNAGISEDVRSSCS